MVDVLIVGAGPAGVSAALTASARGLSTLWFGSRSLSEKLERAELVRNYPGLPDVSGRDMRDAFLRQVDELGIEILEQRVASIYPLGSSFAACAGTDYFEGRALILATGVHAARSLPGEQELLGHGVSCCATCDGELYRGKRIAIVCEDPSLEDEVAFLADLAETVALFTPFECETPLPGRVERFLGTPTAIVGNGRVEGVEFDGGLMPFDGVFCLRKSVSPQALLQGLETIDGHIVVDRSQRTSIAGCFAAGDCTGRPYQFAKAVGEGNVAAHSAAEYLKSAR